MPAAVTRPMSRIHARALTVPPTSPTNEGAAHSVGLDVAARLAAIDVATMNFARLARVREQLTRFGYGSALLSDPLNIRYAVGARNMQVWTMHRTGSVCVYSGRGPSRAF